MFRLCQTNPFRAKLAREHLLCAKSNHCQEVCTQEGSKRPRREFTIFGLGPQALLQHPENLSRGRIFGKKLNKSLFSVKRTTQKPATRLECTPVSVNISSLSLQYNYLELSFYWNSFEEWWNKLANFTYFLDSKRKEFCSPR